MNNVADELRIMTLQAHILEEQAHQPHRLCLFLWVPPTKSMRCSLIWLKCRRAETIRP